MGVSMRALYFGCLLLGGLDWVLEFGIRLAAARVKSNPERPPHADGLTRA